MFFVRAILLFICTVSSVQLFASQNVFTSYSGPSVEDAAPVVNAPSILVPEEDMVDTVEATSDVEVKTPETIPVPEVKPAIDADPKGTVFRYSGADWKKRSAKDYGLEKRYAMEVNPTWETKTPKPYTEMGSSYTQYAAFIIDHFGDNLIDGPHEFTRRNSVCPKYNTLSRAQKIEFWVHFTSAFAKPESGYKPKDRMRETTMGTDSVTKEHVYSEGLLQLSYQDMRSYPKECGNVFDWEHDKKISRTSDEKTIFDPMRNLYCGLRILNKIVGNRKSIYFDKNHYWAVLKPNGRYGKVESINKEVRQQTPFCR